MNYFIIFLLAVIFVSLACGAYFLQKDKSESRRTLTALKIRVGVSVLLVLALIAGKYMGVLEGNQIVNQQVETEKNRGE